MPRENAFVNVFQREKWRVQQGKKVSAYQHGTSKNAIRLNLRPSPCTIANPPDAVSGSRFAAQEQKQINDLVEELELCICSNRDTNTSALASPRGDDMARVYW